MSQKVVIGNEVVKVRGRTKAFVIPKDKFDEFLRPVELRILDKKYTALMPPIDDDMVKNKIDFGGLAQIVAQWWILATKQWIGRSVGVTGTPPAQIILTTPSGSNLTFNYASSITPGSSGVSIFVQLYDQNGSYNWQYFYVLFDTTSNAYSASGAELYVSAFNVCPVNFGANQTSNLIRIATTNTSISKTSNDYLFFVWLIEFIGIPPYLMVFVPNLANPANVGFAISSSNCGGGSITATVYFNTGSCQFKCGGNCPKSNLGSYIVYVGNNGVVLEFPIQVPLGSPVSNLQALLCTSIPIYGVGTISGSNTTQVSSNVTGATYYAVVATVSITFAGS